MSALRPRSAPQAGATLVEIVVTVAVLGVAAMIAVPRSNPVDAVATEAVAAEIATALRFGQQEAIRTGRYHVVQIDPATNTLSVFRLTGSGQVNRDNTFTVLHPIDRREFLVAFTNTGVSGTTIVASVFQYSGGATTNAVSFGPDGVPATINGTWLNGAPSSRNALLGNGVVTIRQGMAERQVRLDPVTGRVTY